MTILRCGYWSFTATSLSAYSCADCSSWIEHGQTTTKSLESSHRIILRICWRSSHIRSWVISIIGNISFISWGDGSIVVERIRTSSDVAAMVSDWFIQKCIKNKKISIWLKERYVYLINYQLQKSTLQLFLKEEISIEERRENNLLHKLDSIGFWYDVKNLFWNSTKFLIQTHRPLFIICQCEYFALKKII